MIPAVGKLVGAASGVLKAGGGKDKDKDGDSAGAQRAQLKAVREDYAPSYHKGGKVRRTGLARLKKGEVVLSRKQARKHGAKRSSKRA